ncbi:hypothetical protein GGQ80_002317 [Sphingomonas jinjuensis]|uniref:Uncharacterized protein n=1 Tax=Sphingomonas jinjuensis TaxID=535907 RepID=A0A840FFA5_9SPHN|nr:hypothetical protein [Sphingomonas jinjuensis]MBB4154404.1 hypothetical protein [Sphingomonas jinjuensis]
MTTPARTASTGLRPVEPSIADRMRRDLRGETDETLTEQFGISYNTWRKIRSGQAIRESLAARIEDRLR